MNPVIRAQLSEFVKANSLDLLEESAAFEIYSIFSILQGLLGESVDAYEVHLAGNEFGLDGVAILIQGELVRNRVEAQEKLAAIRNPSVEFIFFQSKTSATYDYGEISKFFDAIKEFFDGQLAQESQQVADLVDAMYAIYEHGVGKRNPKLSAFYVATGNYEAPRRIEQLKKASLNEFELLNIFDGEITLAMVGAKQLQEWYRAATTAVEVEIDFERNVVLPTNSNVEQSYIGYLPAGQLAKLFTILDAHGDVVGINKAVFFDNIRDYNPNSEINLEIKESVRAGGGHDFVFRNNGITVVSKNIVRTADRFRLEDYQIVNGCQTSNIIYDLLFGPERAEYSEKDLSNSISVPFRLIGSKNDDFIASIIVGTNRQNALKDEQFWALRPFMKNFEEYARSVEADAVLYFERREHQYRGQAVERVRVVQPSVMTKALAATILFQPHRAARDYRGIISEYEEALFQEEHDVRVYHAACFLHYRLEYLWRNQKLDTRLKTFRYYILSAVGWTISGGGDVLKMRKNKAERFAKNVISVSKNEDVLKSVAVNVGVLIDEKLQEMGLGQAQEKIRDAIRSEQFADKFWGAVKSNAPRELSSFALGE